MTFQPTLETSRLILRPFNLNDASRVQLLAGDKRIPDGTRHIPHPYPDGLAEQWIGSHADAWNRRDTITCALCLKSDDLLIGAASLMQIRNDEAELGYWIGVPFWNRGYCTEAVQQLIHFGFGELGLRKIYSRHLTRNPASGKVLLKAGMVYRGQEELAVPEGTLELFDLVRDSEKEY